MEYPRRFTGIDPLAGDLDEEQDGIIAKRSPRIFNCSMFHLTMKHRINLLIFLLLFIVVVMLNYGLQTDIYNIAFEKISGYNTNSHISSNNLESHIKLKKQVLMRSLKIPEGFCKPVKNIYFLKMHKTGSSTFYNLLGRYAWRYNLTMATFTEQPFESNDVHPIISKLIPPFDGKTKYNMMAYHAVYDESDINKILYTDHYFVTLLREPLSRLRSFLNFYKKMTKNAGLPSNQPMEELIKRLNTSKGNISAFKKIRDTMAYEFAIPPDISVQSIEFQTKVKHLTERFFIGLTECYIESVVLLKRLLCWKSHQDVVFLHIRKYSYKVLKKNEEEKRKIMCSWSDKDCYLYNLFHNIFWKKVQDSGQDFLDEVSHVELLNILVKSYCAPIISHIKKHGWRQDSNETSHFNPLQIPASKWSPSFQLKPLDCALMYLDERVSQLMFYLVQNPAKCLTLKRKCPMHSTSLAWRECLSICKRGSSKKDILYKVLSMKHSYLFEGVDSIT